MVPNVLIAMTALLGCLALGGLALGAAECPEEWEGDGYCDMTADGTDCNTAEHDWDGGDCCADSAAESDDGHGPWGFECLDPDHQDSYKIRVDYHGYALWMHCNKTQRAGYAYRFKYELLPDTHDYKRKKSGAYIKDKNIPDECQQRQGGTCRFPLAITTTSPHTHSLIAAVMNRVGDRRGRLCTPCAPRKNT